MVIPSTMKPNNRSSHHNHVRGLSRGSAERRPVIVVHGGAWDIPKALHRESIQSCREAAKVGWAVLGSDGTALEAVEAAVRVLESAAVFDAGRGSVLNAMGEIEMDAIIMDGRDLNLGAVMAVKQIRHPVSLARTVMSESDHTILVGEGAESFARAQGVPLCPGLELFVDREVERWRYHRESVHREDPRSRDSVTAAPGGTVGAVAVDAAGHVASATSTGGTFNKHPGRVGDSPLVGCGAYADDCTGAVSATGDGEHLMKIVISKLACDHLDRGMTAQQAADAAIALLRERTVGRGGLIVLTNKGEIGIAHSTANLAHAYVTPGDEIIDGLAVDRPLKNLDPPSRMG